MKHCRILFPFLLIIGLFSFMPSDTVLTDTTKAPIEIKVQTVNQSPKSKICYEKINQLQARKATIQESIDSVYNVLDSIDTSTKDTNRQHKIVLFDRNGCKESLRSLLSKRTEQTDNKQEGRSDYAFTNTIFTESSHLHQSNSNLDRTQQTPEVNNHKRDGYNSLITNDFNNSINGEIKLDLFRNTGNDTGGYNNIFCSIYSGQSKEQNRLFGNTERTKCRIRQTAFSIGRKDEETLVFIVG